MINTRAAEYISAIDVFIDVQQHGHIAVVPDVMMGGVNTTVPINTTAFLHEDDTWTTTEPPDLLPRRGLR